MQFQISSRRETRYLKIPESSRLEFLKKFLAKNFALWDVKDNTSRPLNRGIADLTFLRTLSAIGQKSWESNVWEVISLCFRNICKFGSFLNPYAMTDGCLNFTLNLGDLLLVKQKMWGNSLVNFKSLDITWGKTRTRTTDYK